MFPERAGVSASVHPTSPRRVAQPDVDSRRRVAWSRISLVSESACWSVGSARHNLGSDRRFSRALPYFRRRLLADIDQGEPTMRSVQPRPGAFLAGFEQPADRARDCPGRGHCPADARSRSTQACSGCRRRSHRRHCTRSNNNEAPGRDADSPAVIPPRGWLEVLRRVWSEIGKDNMSIIAAGCAFYALLALFPAITALVAIYGIVADPATIEQQIGAIGRRGAAGGPGPDQRPRLMRSPRPARPSSAGVRRLPSCLPSIVPPPA